MELRQWMVENDPDAQKIIEWSESQVRRLPESAEEMAGEVIWIILCAGRSAQAARTIEKRVWEAIRGGLPVVSAYGYKAKAEAIERAWRERHHDFDSLCRVGCTDAERLVEWCGAIPFVGDDTKFQLAKNFGVDCVKPDIWVSRLCGFPDRPRRAVKIRFPACMAMCRPLAAATGDRIATVDSVLWLACNKGVLQVGADAGPVQFVKKLITAKSIFG